MAYCFGGVAELAMADGDPERAARALGAAENLFSEIGSAMDPTRMRRSDEFFRM